MTNWIISLLIVTVCVQIVIIHFYRMQNADLRRELADATDWIDPIAVPHKWGTAPIKWDERFEDKTIEPYKIELQKASPEDRKKIIKRAEEDIHLFPEHVYVIKEIAQKLANDDEF